MSRDKERLTVTFQLRNPIGFICRIEGDSLDAPYAFEVGVLFREPYLRWWGLTAENIRAYTGGQGLEASLVSGCSASWTETHRDSKEVTFRAVGAMAPIIETMEAHRLSKEEHVKLLRYWFPKYPDPKKITAYDKIDSGVFETITPHDQIDPGVNEIFRDLLKKILEPAGYVVTIKVARPPIPTVRVSLHAEWQKMGRTMPEQLELWSRDRTLPQEKPLLLTGLDLSVYEDRALYGIQKLLDDTSYKGNRLPKILDPDNPFGLAEPLPCIEVKLPGYLDACGVAKKRTGRGKMEYDRGERRGIVEGLLSLSRRIHPVGYEKKTFTKGKKGSRQELSDIIIYERPLINIARGYAGLKQDEVDRLKRGGGEPRDKLYTLWIIPSPLLVDQIDTYFLLKPENLYRELRERCRVITGRRITKYDHRFIEWLIIQCEYKRRGNQSYEAEINERLLATRLRMDSWISHRQWSRISENLIKYCELAKSMGYLKKWERIQGLRDHKYVFVMNSDRCLSVRPPKSIGQNG